MANDKKELKEGITVQVVGGIRSFTIPSEDIIKIHRGCLIANTNHPRFSKLTTITPKSIVTVTPERGKWLLKYTGVQKFGVDKL
jgi:hypothetical protein